MVVVMMMMMMVVVHCCLSTYPPYSNPQGPDEAVGCNTRKTTCKAAAMSMFQSCQHCCCGLFVSRFMAGQLAGFLINQQTPLSLRCPYVVSVDRCFQAP